MLPADFLRLDLILFAVGCLVTAHFLVNRRRIPKGTRLPPGPPRKPIIGNLRDMPTVRAWETVTEWKKQYGDIVYVEVLGQPSVFLNSLEVARTLFEGRSAIYSDRRESQMLKMTGWDYNFGLMRYGSCWRRHRKKFHEHFNPKRVAAYNKIQKRLARDMLKGLLSSPEDWQGHLTHISGAIIMEVVYGIRIKDKGDHWIEIAEHAMESVNAAVGPAAFIVDRFPILKHLPEWMPGVSWKKKVRMWREPTTEMVLGTFKTVKDALITGKAPPSIMTSCLTELAHDATAPPDEEVTIRNICGVAYTAGAGSTAAAMRSFILAMVLYPDAQRKAQAELDAVLGNRLPSLDDRENLPYLSALCEELQRWRPVAPIVISHATTQDDVYGEYFIPKGTAVFGNAWSILHDEIYGADPEEFKPERFLVRDAKLPTAQWGFGRRICPGRHLANNSIFIEAALILKVFEIGYAKDVQGKDIPISGLYTSGLVCEPEPFVCSIKPRSEATRKLILEDSD